MKRSSILILLAVAMVLGLTACGRRPTNVLVVTFDTTRSDHVGYQGGPEGITPTLDALAAEGTWFSTAIASQPLTLPSHTTILTGLQPYHHGVRNNGGYVLREDVTTLAERLKSAGYQTHAIVSSFVLDSQFGLDQGFDEYDDDLAGGPRPAMFMFREILGSRVVEKALNWLDNKKEKDRPFFLWLHFYDPHATYDPPEDVALQYPGDPYSAEIHFADRELGRVITRLREEGLYEDTLIVFAADHGESLGEHGERTHGIFVYDSTIHVPMFLRGPGVPEGKRVDALARSVDLTPTVLDLLNISTSDSFDGRSLVDLMKGDEDEPRVAYSESLAPLINFGWGDLRAHRTATTLVVDAPRPEIYDLSKDPTESRNLYETDSDQPQDARRILAQLKRVVRDDPFTRGEQQADNIDPETKKKLAALGYVFGTVRDVEGPRADPKDRIVQWEDFQTAQALIRGKRFDEAVVLIRRLLDVDPDNVTAMGSLANALSASHHPNESLEVFRKMIARDPNRENGYLGAAKVLLEERRFEEAIPLARAVIELQPKNPEGYTALGDIFLETEEYAEAESLFRKAFELDPHSTLAISGLGNCLNRMGRQKEALEVLEEGFKREPESQAIVYNLAVVTDRLGDTKTAFVLYRKSLEIDAQHSMTWNNLGSLFDRQGQRKQAIQCIAKAHELDPDNVEATYNLGALLLAAGGAAEALPYLEEALQRRPTLVQAAVQRANALAALDRTDEAILQLRRIAQVAPGAWLQIARLENKRGNTAAARQAIANAISRGGQPFADAVRRDPGLSALAPGA